MAAITRTTTQRRNPVLWQEKTHQLRSAPRGLGLGPYLGVLFVLSILIGIPITLQQIDNPTREIALVAIWVTHAAVATRCIIAGANAISREHVGQTWDALVLTGVSARKILLGKWLAAMHRVRGWMLALGVIRLAMLPIFTLALLNRFAWLNLMRYGTANPSSVYYGNNYSYGDPYVIIFTWVPWASVLSVVMTLLLTFLEVAGCTALGLAASAITRRGGLAMIFALSVRFAPVAIFTAFTNYEIGPSSFRWYRFAPFALADGGTSPLYQLSLPLMPWTQGRHMEALPGLLLSTLLVSVILVCSLAVTLRMVRRSGALSQAQIEASTTATA